MPIPGIAKKLSYSGGYDNNRPLMPANPTAFIDLPDLTHIRLGTHGRVDDFALAELTTSMGKVFASGNSWHPR
jgi:hypothetical protein